MAGLILGLPSAIVTCSPFGAVDDEAPRVVADGGLEATTRPPPVLTGAEEDASGGDPDDLVDAHQPQRPGVRFPGNGHSYLVVMKTVFWREANADALARGGYLATITSAAENDFVWDLVTKTPGAAYLASDKNMFGPWFGAIQDPNAQEPDRGWGWGTKEPWSFTAWWSEQPDNNLVIGRENHIHYYAFDTMRGTWGDINEESPRVRSYVVEFDP